MASEITVERKDGLAVVSLNRPDKLNALTLEMRVELTECFRRMHTDPEVRAILLRAEGRAFCAGADISTMGKDDVWGDRARLFRAHQMILAIYNCEKPVVAAVRGPAVGIRLSMALAWMSCCFQIQRNSVRSFARSAWPRMAARRSFFKT